MGRFTSPSYMTIRRITTNLQTKNKHTCQKIELYGSPTTKDLKKKHSSRLVGRVERTWCCVGGGNGKATVAASGTSGPHSHVVDKNWEGKLGSK